MEYEGKTMKRELGTAENAPLASAIGGEYEVFLSFRGNDTRKGFTDFLYNDLDDKGIHTFRDDDELRVGEEIGPKLLQAIKESKISIPIFSQNYASSKWCLLELAQMVECQKTMGQKILPIFYDVEPYDVRHQTGSYEEAFGQHEKVFDEKTVQEWREALREVGQLKGWELEKKTDGHQGKLVKLVVLEVLLELKKNYMVVTDNLVGIDHHIEEMKRLLNVDSNDVRIVGIYGMGGIGKTTIAKVVYNKLSECFDCCCFLADVREMSQQYSGLVNLQKQLISKIRKGKFPDIVNVDEGINMIKGMACKKKVLIVLDDVDNESQFAKLVGKCNWFGSGSRIIVTTRNKGVLNVFEVYEAYEPQPMELDDALQLFRKCAFRQSFPLEDYDDLSKKVVSTTGRLPLALEIIGSFLYGQGKVVWKETLKKLKSIPHDQVQKQLRISFEALNSEERQIFLDIACLFIGVDQSLPFYMWNDCKFNPTSGISALVLRSLVKVGDDNKLWMHDQLRDLGRAIICEENLEMLGERSRLWIHKDAVHILDKRKGTTKVEALCLHPLRLTHRRHKNSFTNNEFGKVPNLRFLRLYHTDLTGDFKHLLSNLRWLQWHGCPNNFKPVNFHLKNLVILDLSESFITDNWEGWGQIKMAKRLKVLDLSYCNGLRRTPDFSTFATLERLILKGCVFLFQIHPSIGNLVNLTVLDISASGVRKLPDAIGNLKKLKEINASQCRSFEGVIPSSIVRLSSLRVLNLNSTWISSLPKSICRLSSLQTLDLASKLGPELPSSLTSLRLSCDSMETFSSISNMVNLKEFFCTVSGDRDWKFFNYSSSKGELEIPRDISRLSKLETLHLVRTSIITLPVEIGALSALKELNVGFCERLRCILGLPSSLFSLCLTRCQSVERLPDLSNLKILSELKLVWCYKLIEIQGLGKLELLTSLNVCGSSNLHELDGLEQLEFLRYLNASWCRSLERLPNLSNLKQLQELFLKGCMKLTAIQGLDRLESLKHLDMTLCYFIKRLPDLSNLGMLRKLNLFGCKNLVDVGGLWGLESLERLNVSWCNLLESFLDLSKLKNLKKLTIRGWKNLTDVWGLEELESLELLDIAECRLLEKSLDLSNLKKLKELKVPGCEKLTEIRGLGELKSLKLLDVSECYSMENLPNLPSTHILTDSLWSPFLAEIDDIEPCMDDINCHIDE